MKQISEAEVEQILKRYERQAGGYPPRPRVLGQSHEPKPKCPRCLKYLKLRNGKNGEFYGCSGYPQCVYTAPVERVEAAIRKELERRERG